MRQLAVLMLVLFGSIIGCGYRYEPEAPAPGKDAAPDGEETAATDSPDAGTPSKQDTEDEPTNDPSQGIPAGPAAKPEAKIELELSDEARAKIALLAEEERMRRLPGIEYLDSLGEEATDYLLAAMGDEHADLRAGAAFGLLARFRAWDERMVAAFQRALEDPDPRVRNLALTAFHDAPQALLERAAPGAVEILRGNEDDAHVRAKAARLLSQSDETGGEALREILLDSREDKAVRAACLKALADRAGEAPEKAELLGTVLGDDSQTTPRRLAAIKLGQMGPAAKPAVDALVKLLGSDDESLRAAAARALIRIGQPAAAALQSAAKRSTDAELQERYRAVLQRMERPGL